MATQLADGLKELEQQLAINNASTGQLLDFDSQSLSGTLEPTEVEHLSMIEASKQGIAARDCPTADANKATTSVIAGFEVEVFATIWSLAVLHHNPEVSFYKVDKITHDEHRLAAGDRVVLPVVTDSAKVIVVRVCGKLDLCLTAESFEGTVHGNVILCELDSNGDLNCF